MKKDTDCSTKAFTKDISWIFNTSLSDQIDKIESRKTTSSVSIKFDYAYYASLNSYVIHGSTKSSIVVGNKDVKDVIIPIDYMIDQGISPLRTDIKITRSEPHIFKKPKSTDDTPVEIICHICNSNIIKVNGLWKCSNPDCDTHKIHAYYCLFLSMKLCNLPVYIEPPFNISRELFYTEHPYITCLSIVNQDSKKRYNTIIRNIDKRKIPGVIDIKSIMSCLDDISETLPFVVGVGRIGSDILMEVPIERYLSMFGISQGTMDIVSDLIDTVKYIDLSYGEIVPAHRLHAILENDSNVDVANNPELKSALKVASNFAWIFKQDRKITNQELEEYKNKLLEVRQSVAAGG